MVRSLVALLLRRVLASLVWNDKHAKDLEIVVLRHQLQVLRRQVGRPRFGWSDRLFLAAASRRLARETWRAFLVTPQTVLRWHRELVRWKWSYSARGRPGRPALDEATRAWILRLAGENPRWGYQRIRGELAKLGRRVSATAIRTLLSRHGLGPAPRRGGVSWAVFLRQPATSILACDFFTVETVWRKTLYVLFFIELGSRRVHLGGCTANPDPAWVTQQARNLAREWSMSRVRCGSWCATGTASSPGRLTRSFGARPSGCSARPCGHPGPTPTRSAGSGQCGRSASTGSSFEIGRIWSACSESMSATTITTDHTEGSA